MEDYIKLLDSSFDRAKEKIGNDELGALLFEKFFAMYPETPKYFKGTDVSYFRGKKLNIIFVFIKDIIKFPNFAEGHISQEVMRHQMYGLTDKEYYFGLIDCVSITIKEVLESEWTPEYEEAWNDVSMAFKSIVGEAADSYI